MKLPDMHSARASLVSTLKRFPISALCALSFTLLGMINVQARGYHPALPDALFVLFYGCFGFIALRLAVERNPQGVIQKYAAAGVLALVVALWASSGVTAIEQQLIAATAVLLMYVSPYLKLTGNNDQMWTFCYRLSLRVAFTFLAAIVLYLGIVLIISSVNLLLLGNRSADKIYMHMWVIVACLFSPLFAMAGIPTRFEESEETYPKYMRLLLTYIVLPLWLVYIVILYLYIGKTLLQMALPKGEVAWLVSIFGGATIAIYLKGYPLFRKGEKGIATFFAANAFRLLVAPLMLLAVSVFTRISDYGVTEERYLLVVVLLWLSTAIIIRKIDDAKAPRRILLTAIVLMIATAFGPWGMSSVSTRSQFARFEALLISNEVLVNGKAVKPLKEIPFKAAGQISDSIDYFVGTEKEALLKPWFANADEVFACKKDCENQYRYSIDYALRRQIATALGITYLDRWERTEKEQSNLSNSFFFDTHKDERTRYYDVSGYDALIQFKMPDYYTAQNHGWKIGPLKINTSGGRQVSITFECKVDPAICELDTGPEFKPLTFDVGDAINKQEWKNGKLVKDDVIIVHATDGGATFEAKMEINNIRGRFLKEKMPELSELRGHIYLKRNE